MAFLIAVGKPSGKFPRGTAQKVALFCSPTATVAFKVEMYIASCWPVQRSFVARKARYASMCSALCSSMSRPCRRNAASEALTAVDFGAATIAVGFIAGGWRDAETPVAGETPVARSKRRRDDADGWRDG